jgi:hypothetical protein
VRKADKLTTILRRCQEIWEPELRGTLWTTPKVKESRNRPGVAQRVPGGLVSQIPLHSALEGGEVVSFTHRPPLLPGMFLELIFTRG